MCASFTLQRRRSLGFVFQFHHLLPACTALENVTLPLLMREGSVSPPARARARELLADEPTGNLDTKSYDEVYALLRRLHAECGTALAIVTHDPRLAARCDRVVERVDGRIEKDRVQAALGPAH